MAETVLKSAEMKAFCENVALMLSVGIQTDEAVHMLAENSESKPLEGLCRKVYMELIHGVKLSSAMASAGGFPTYAIEMVAASERTGHVQNTLESLATYYDEEARLISKIRQSVTYPAILLCVMSIVLAFVVANILPVFLDVYENMAGGITASSFGAVDVGIIIGWVALVFTLVCTLIALVALVSSRSASGRDRLMRMINRIPGAKKVFYTLALSRFTSTLSVYIASGANSDDAMGQAISTIELPELKDKATQAHRSMIESVRAKSLIQAVADYQVFDPIHVRMLTFGMRSGRIDEVLEGLSEDLFGESIAGFDSLIDRVEPILAGFVTLAIGLTLIAVMLPLVGMMGSIG